MRKLGLYFLITALLLLSMSACAKNSSVNTLVVEKTEDPSESSVTKTVSADNDETTVEEAAETEEVQESEAEENKTLVVYFSVTGTTKGIAEKIAEITSADVYEITAADEYTEDDLNYNDSGTRATVEQKDPDIRPEIGSGTLSLDGYSTIFIGYPIWWGEEPRIMDTFVESYNFDGITLIPFCTSGSSGIGSSGINLANNANSGNWLEGKRFASSAEKDDIETWINELLNTY